MEDYQGILFPDRAENLERFEGYKIFLSHWDPLGSHLRRMYEGLALRGDTRVLAIHGEQGAGKTLFASKLHGDIARTKSMLGANGTIAYDDQNIWHRATGGQDQSAALVQTASQSVSIKLIENDKDWLRKTTDWLAPEEDRSAIIVADNAERAYFRQGLIDVNDAEFARISGSPEAMKMVAQNFVAKCRGELRRCLFLILSNDEEFLLTFESAVESQHQTLVTLESLPLPSGSDKETVVRVNTNRLNRISYWYCLDKAGPTEKRAVREALVGTSTYPGAFAAVDNAIRTAEPRRVGRPAMKNRISLIVLSGKETNAADVFGGYPGDSRLEFEDDIGQARIYQTGWAAGALETDRERALLESEWELRVVLLGERFVAALLSPDMAVRERCGALIEKLKQVLGPGTHQATRDAAEAAIVNDFETWPDVDVAPLADFWAKGAVRSAEYEGALKTLLPEYDVSGDGFMAYRPDLIVNGFSPCSVVRAISNDRDAINIAIRRDAHVMEFTAQVKATYESVSAYLAGKLPNYLQITQEQ